MDTGGMHTYVGGMHVYIVVCMHTDLCMHTGGYIRGGMHGFKRGCIHMTERTHAYARVCMHTEGFCPPIRWGMYVYRVVCMHII